MKNRICSVPNCGKPSRSNGFCVAHHKRWYRYGDPLYRPPVGGKRKAENYACGVEGCDATHETDRITNGFCTKHYKRLLRYGNPLKSKKISNGTRYAFLVNVALRFESDECLTWPYCKASDGRGKVTIPNEGEVLAHRYLCELVYGSPPTPLHHASHSCGKGDHGCINPKHLRWATPEENEADKVVHGTSNRGERCGSNKLTEAEVRKIRELAKTMRPCQIAKLCTVTESAVRSIRDRKTWAWLP